MRPGFHKLASRSHSAKAKTGELAGLPSSTLPLPPVQGASEDAAAGVSFGSPAAAKPWQVGLIYPLEGSPTLWETRDRLAVNRADGKPCAADRNLLAARVLARRVVGRELGGLSVMDGIE